MRAELARLWRWGSSRSAGGRDPGLGSGRSRTIAAGVVLAGVLVPVGDAAGAVVLGGGGDEHRPPASLWVGTWSGGSAVAVAPSWILTAEHTGGSVGVTTFVMNGRSVTATEFVDHPSADLRLVRVDQKLEGYHPVGGVLSLNQEVVLAGAGRVAGASNGTSIAWSNTRRVEFGHERVDRISGSSVRFMFDGGMAADGKALDPADVIADEASWTQGDSGGGVFTLINGPGGPELRLSAIATSVVSPTYGVTSYGSLSYALAVEPYLAWIRQTIGTFGDGGLQSSRPPPLTNTFLPPDVGGPLPTPGGTTLLAIGAVLATTRRRRVPA